MLFDSRNCSDFLSRTFLLAYLHLNPAPASDEFPIVLFVSAAKYIDIQLWIVLSTGLGLQIQHGQSSGLYVCIVSEIGVIFGNYYYHGYLLVTLYLF